MATINPVEFSSHLTKLYSETKKSAVKAVPRVEVGGGNAAFAALHRKFRIQKDRLVTWGLEWSEEEKDGEIDESVAKAGLTETVTSVLGNIKEVLDEADQIRAASSPSGSKGSEKLGFFALWSVADEGRYQDLLKDLTTSIDTLYDLTRSRRALIRGDHPRFDTKDAATTPGKPPSSAKLLFRPPSFASSEITLVNPPSFARPTLSPYAGLPPRIDPTALRLPEEGPPPYESLGTPATARFIAGLIRGKTSETVQKALGSSNAEVPVLVEYSTFDSTYRATGVPPPLQRLEALVAVAQPMRVESQTSISLIGYFEDPHQPRIGLVYDLPYSVQNGAMTAGGQDYHSLTPTSLLKLLQQASKSSNSPDPNAPPALEHRFRIALRLTEQLRALHAEDFTHGNINSNSVLFTSATNTQNSSPADLRVPIWSSYDLFSKCNVENTRKLYNLNIYKHPNESNDTASTELANSIAFDMYSLGTLLLEIGLWIPLGDLYKAKYSPADFKLRLEKLWIPKLAAKCGSAYMRAAQHCLGLADSSIERSLTLDRVYETVLRNLHRCCLLDEEDSLSSEQHVQYTAVSRSAALDASTGKLLKKKRHPSSARRSPIELHRSGETQRAITRKPVSLQATLQPAEQYRIGSMPNIAAALPAAMAGLSPSSEVLYTTPETLERKSFSDIRERASSAASSMQQAWRARKESSSLSFHDYKRKVTLIQQHWRERCARRECQPSPITDAPHPNPNASVDSTQKADENTKDKAKLCEWALSLPSDMLFDWQTRTGPQLVKLVERALKGCVESSSIDLVAYGASPDTARPTYLVCCTSVAKVKAILKKRFDYDHTTYDVRVRKGRVRRSRRSNKRRATGGTHRSMAPDCEPDDAGTAAANPFYQQRPLCGASIGAYREQHLPPVSFGGVVLVDDVPYGMSVHHMLDVPSDADDEDVPDDELSDDDEGDTLSDVTNEDEGNTSDYESNAEDGETISGQPSKNPLAGSSSASQHSLETLRQGNASVASSVLTAINVAHADSTEEEPGDVPGIAVGSEEIPITQPALDDAVEMDLHADDATDSERDEDHLLSYKLGNIHASSGLRRRLRKKATKPLTCTQPEGTSATPCDTNNYTGPRELSALPTTLPQEIDWALIELLPPRIQPFNVIAGGKRHCKVSSKSTPPLEHPIDRHRYGAREDFYPVGVQTSDNLGGLRVYCSGRTSGLAEGVVTQAMGFVKLHARTTFSSTWAVIGDFGAGGDSGAWVVANDSGRVCGHVLAENRGLTYICPMDLLLEDIRESLGAETVGLPGAEAEEATSGRRAERASLADVVGILNLNDRSERGAVALATRSRGRHLPLQTDFSKVLAPAQLA